MLLKEQTIYFARILGEPHVNRFDDTKKQWSFDLSVDKDTQKQLLDAGMKKSYIKNKDDEKGAYLSFTRDAVKADGSPGKPIEVVDHKGQPWNQAVKIGNGSKVNIKVALNEREFKGQKFLKPGVISIQIWDFQPYVPINKNNDDFPVAEGEPEICEPLSAAEIANQW